MAEKVWELGAAAQQTRHRVDDWQHLSTAPRDGTVVEMRCTYGVAPWYGLFRWTNEVIGPDGTVLFTRDYPEWVGYVDPSLSVTEDEHLRWRPYNGSLPYVDPTGGAQNEGAYWRGAVATKFGLPADHFEKRETTPVRTILRWVGRLWA